LNLWLRLLWALVSWRGRSRLKLNEVGIRSFRVWPSDLDTFNHMNNGKFLSIQDLGRLDLMLRTGAWKTYNKLGWYPVVVASTITYRKSLELWQKFDLETKIIGWDDIAFYMEQRFVVDGEMYSKSVIRVRFLKRPRGILNTAEVAAAGPDGEGGYGWPWPRPELPEWVAHWAETTQMPKGKEPAPSIWQTEN
jgi:acyl-CoA thioesterase FadM